MTSTDIVSQLRDYEIGYRPHVIGKVLEAAADHIESQNKLIEEMRESLEWMIENDETNEGDVPLPDHGGRTWDEINEYWINGLNRAKTIVQKALSYKDQK